MLTCCVCNWNHLMLANKWVCRIGTNGHGNVQPGQNSNSELIKSLNHFNRFALFKMQWHMATVAMTAINMQCMVMHAKFIQFDIVAFVTLFLTFVKRYHPYPAQSAHTHIKIHSHSTFNCHLSWFHFITHYPCCSINNLMDIDLLRAMKSASYMQWSLSHLTHSHRVDTSRFSPTENHRIFLILFYSWLFSLML